MIIGIDLRAIGQGKYSGVEEYTLNLLSALFAVDGKNKYVLFSSGQKTSERYLDFSQKAKEKNPNVGLRHQSVPNRILNVSFKFFGWPKADMLIGETDILFEPNINLFPSSGTKKVVTFHDLSFERYGDFFSIKQLFWHNFVNPEKLAKEADFIIAVSESTKSDLREIYGIPDKKIKVIYSGIKREQESKKEDLAAVKVKKKYNLPEKFILYLGTIEPRKNIAGLIKAFELMKKNRKSAASDYKLVIAGSKGWLCDDIFRAAEDSICKDKIIFTGFISDRDKKYLYQLAGLFVYPSFYEGFGFPPLEAMEFGVPVITSDCSSLPEVAGEAAITVNPYNTEEIARAMEQVLSDDSLRKNLIGKGFAQAKKFSWDKCARETLKVFELIDHGL